MSIREILNRNSSYTIVIVAILVVIAGYMVIRQFGGGTSAPGRASAFYFTTDEKTWFTDSPDKLAPFDKDGKEAVRAHVYKCTDGTTLIGYLERYTPEAKALKEKFKRDPNSLNDAEKGQYMSLSMTGREVKRPGDAKWSRPSGAPISAKCPDGKPGAELMK